VGFILIPRCEMRESEINLMSWRMQMQICNGEWIAMHSCVRCFY